MVLQASQGPEDHFGLLPASWRIVFLALASFPWFQSLKRRLGNFRLGLTEVTHTYAQDLITFARQQSPAFYTAFTETELTPGPERIGGNSSGTGR